MYCIMINGKKQVKMANSKAFRITIIKAKKKVFLCFLIDNNICFHVLFLVIVISY